MILLATIAHAAALPSTQEMAKNALLSSDLSFHPFGNLPFHIDLQFGAGQFLWNVTEPLFFGLDEIIADAAEQIKQAATTKANDEINSLPRPVRVIVKHKIKTSRTDFA